MQRVIGAAVTTRLSRNRRSALLTASPQQGIGALEPALAGFARAHPQIEIAGTGVGGGSDTSHSDLQRAEKLAVPVTLFVLLIAFGSLVASLVPVLLALTAVVAAFGLLGPISHAFPLDDSVKTAVLLIGMAGECQQAPSYH